MSAPRRRAPEETIQKQRRASDPGGSAWVSANAGSGKTHVLVQRVLRLLLDGAPPSRVLCLTFTKAAAANMATRVFKTLSDWTRFDDASLARAIVETGATAPDEAKLNFARKLFARTIETPGGLKIQTIHAFCERVLHLFPFEANVAAGFRVVEEREAALLMRQARASAFAYAAETPALAAAIETVARIGGPQKFDALLASTLKRRDEIAAHGGARGYAADLRARLGLAADEDEAGLGARMREGGGGPRVWRQWAAVLNTGTLTDKKIAATLICAAATSDPDLALATYWTVFFTKDGPPRKTLANKGVADKHPRIVEALKEEQERLERLEDRLLSARAVARSQALAEVAEAVLDRYAERKNARGWLDFDDLIARVQTLLDKSDAAWVLYKLDAGIEHILVDEAQDTSRAQWDILRKLSADFLDGESARSKSRTFFAVGDEKQSIFSFQGAAPTMFDEMRREFARKHENAKKPFASVMLNLSFRSAPRILDGVDKVFAIPEVWRGVSAGEATAPAHVAFHESLPGLVEVWPTIAPRTSEDSEDWRMPLDAASRNDPPVVLAERIATAIKSWLEPSSAERVIDARTGAPRPIRAGDILILVRSRGAFFEAMTRALRRVGVASAGADRLILRDHLAVMDLVAAGRAALDEDDDLSLAAVLKSPLVGLDDNALLELAPGRPGSLAAALSESPDTAIREAGARVSEWRRRASALTPFAFYARLLGVDGGRRALLGRLGAEAADAVDEFMARALAYEAKEAPSLTRFLAEIEAADVAIKRDMEGEGGGVRVMTAHAAKGLEAPIVFLPDTHGAPNGRHDPDWLELAPQRPGAAPLHVWAGAAGGDSEPLTEARLAARAAAAGEHRRLLYVAMTRAAERLIVCGYKGARELPADCWYNLVRLGLDPHLRQEPAPWDSTQTIGRLGEGAREEAVRPPEAARAASPPPAWLTAPAAREVGSSTLAPSRAASPSDDQVDQRRRERLELGAFAHGLLQRLPEIAPEARAAAGARLLDGVARDWPRDRAERLVGNVIGVLAMPELAPLFAAGSRAEVAIHGRIARPGQGSLDVSGRIDRLAVSQDALYLADFKMGREPPSGAPRDYVKQLALYRALLAPLYPGLPIRAYLVWIEAQAARELFVEELDEALAIWP